MYNAEIIKISNGYYVVKKLFSQTKERVYCKTRKAADEMKKKWENQ